MFCEDCGNIIPEGALFCPNCGKKLPAPEKDETNAFETRKKARQSEEAETTRMISYFSQLESEYKRYNLLLNDYHECLNDRGIAMIVWGSILFFISFLFLSPISTETQYYMINVILIFLFVNGLLGSLSMIIVPIVRRVIFNKRKTEIIRLSQCISQHYNDYGECTISIEYTSPGTLKKILRTIGSGRADTIKEAINILVAETRIDSSRREMKTRQEQLKVTAKQLNVVFVFSPNFFITRY